VGGVIYGGIAGMIEGQSGNELFLHALQDGSIGALTGLTDGLNLGWQLAANAGINAAGEAYKEGLDQLSTGCGKFNGTKIAFAGAAGLVGDLGGNLIGSSLASGATELSHVLQESSAVTESLTRRYKYIGRSWSNAVNNRSGSWQLDLKKYCDE
jgi:hypothetical protein